MGIEIKEQTKEITIRLWSHDLQHQINWKKSDHLRPKCKAIQIQRPIKNKWLIYFVQEPVFQEPVF